MNLKGRNYISRLSWERLGVPLVQLVEAAGERNVNLPPHTVVTQTWITYTCLFYAVSLQLLSQKCMNVCGFLMLPNLQ